MPSFAFHSYYYPSTRYQSHVCAMINQPINLLTLWFIRSCITIHHSGICISNSTDHQVVALCYLHHAQTHIIHMAYMWHTGILADVSSSCDITIPFVACIAPYISFYLQVITNVPTKLTSLNLFIYTTCTLAIIWSQLHDRLNFSKINSSSTLIRCSYHSSVAGLKHRDGIVI